MAYNTDCAVSVSFQWPIDEIKFYCFYNAKHIHEVIFYHPSTSTLIATDLAFNYFESNEQSVRAEGYLFRFYLWLADGYRQASVTKPFKFFFRRNVGLIKNDFDELMMACMNFDRLIMAHGTVIQHGGYQAFQSGTYQFVLDLYEEEKHRKNTWSVKTKIALVIMTGAAFIIAVRYYQS